MTQDQVQQMISFMKLQVRSIYGDAPQEQNKAHNIYTDFYAAEANT